MTTGTRLGAAVLLLSLPMATSLGEYSRPAAVLDGGTVGAAGPAQVAAQPEGASGLPPRPNGRHHPAPTGAPGFVLRGVRFEGGEGLPDAGREDIVKPFIGQWTTLADLEELRYRLTKLYVDQGYINSGVVIKPGQAVRDGIVVFQVIPGRLSEIRVTGQGRLRPSYITDRLRPDAGAAFNREALQERFQLLLRDPLIAQIKGALRPGPEPGTAILDLDVTRARPWELYLRADNYRPPSTGAERAYVGGVVRNLTGFGDALDFYVGLGFQGRDNEGAINWSLPVNARDTRISLGYERTDAPLIEQPLADLDIDSETQRIALGISHPIWRSLRDSLTLGGLLTWAENTTTLLGEPFSFSAGAVNGESRAAAIRFVQEYARYDARLAYALRSVFSYGLDAFDATIHSGHVPDSRFFTWLAQAQAVWRLGERGTQLILRGVMQLADDALLPLEQFSVGGVNTVRGYPENELVGDSGYAASLELRYPLWQGIGFADTRHLVQLAVFTDTGSAWDHGQRGRRKDLYSVGVGLLWNFEERLRAELYLAHALTQPIPRQDYNLQDDGVNFMVQVNF